MPRVSGMGTGVLEECGPRTASPPHTHTTRGDCLMMKQDTMVRGGHVQSTCDTPVHRCPRPQQNCGYCALTTTRLPAAARVTPGRKKVTYPEVEGWCECVCV